MPEIGRKSLTVRTNVYDQIRKRYDRENELNDKSFILWLSDYIKIHLDHDDLLKTMYPHLEILQIKNNILYVENFEIPNEIIKAKLTDNKLEISPHTDEYFALILTIPELSRLKNNP